MLINLCARPDGARASESTALGSASSRRVIKRVRRADDSGTVSCAHTHTHIHRHTPTQKLTIAPLFRPLQPVFCGPMPKGANMQLQCLHCAPSHISFALVLRITSRKTFNQRATINELAHFVFVSPQVLPHLAVLHLLHRKRAVAPSSLRAQYVHACALTLVIKQLAAPPKRWQNRGGALPLTLSKRMRYV